MDLIPLLNLPSFIQSQKAYKRNGVESQRAGRFGPKQISAQGADKYSSYTPRFIHSGSSSKRSTIGVSQLTSNQLLQILRPKPTSKQEQDGKDAEKRTESAERSNSPSKGHVQNKTPQNLMRKMLSDRVINHDHAGLGNTRVAGIDQVVSSSPDKYRNTNSYSSLLINSNSPFLSGNFEFGFNQSKTHKHNSNHLVQRNPAPISLAQQSQGCPSPNIDLILSHSDSKRIPTNFSLTNNRHQKPMSSFSARKILGVVPNHSNQPNNTKHVHLDSEGATKKKVGAEMRQTKQSNKKSSSRQMNLQEADARPQAIVGISRKQVTEQLGYMQNFTDRILQRAKRVTQLH
jgi:hypothetical protein